jgi:hypothetical protein
VLMSYQDVIHPQQITAARVLQESNVERRRALIELMGTDRFVREANPQVLHQDVEHNGNARQLLRVILPTLRARWRGNDEPIVMLSVTCPSTAHHYMLRVPPHIATCRQAAAWIAGFDDPDQYQPIMET